MTLHLAQIFADTEDKTVKLIYQHVWESLPEFQTRVGEFMEQQACSLRSKYIPLEEDSDDGL